jgi:uncharacterized protein YdhG (YjbR/CyaY superfamily)
MAWVKVPAENHPKFHAALPRDPRVETRKLFGGVAAMMNGHLFAGLFGRSTMIWLPEGERAAALALPGASPFDPMGNGRFRSDKVMLPERMMDAPAELRHWIARAFAATAKLPPKRAERKAAKRGKTPALRKPSTIDAYLSNVRGERRAALDDLRRKIHSAIPEAEECISYGMPAFRLNGTVVAGFSATARGCSYFPFSGTTLRTLARDVAAYDRTKSALHFGPGKPLPAALVRKLIKARAAEKASLKRRELAR